MPTNPQQLGEKLKAYRQLKNLSLAATAALCGVAEPVLENLEQGINDAASLEEGLCILSLMQPQQFGHKAQQEQLSALQRTDTQRQILNRITTHPAILEGDLQEAADTIVKAVAETLNVEMVGIWAQGEALGIICSEHVETHREWNSDEIAFHGEVANLIAMVLINCERRESKRRLLAQQKRHQRQENALNALTIAQDEQEINLNDAIARVCSTAAEVLQAEYAGVWLYDEDNTWLNPAALYCLSTNNNIPALRYQRQESEEFFNRLERERTITSSHARQDVLQSSFMASMEKYGSQPCVDCIVRISGESIGFFSIEHTETRIWHSDETAFCTAVADHIAQLIIAHQRRCEGDAYADVFQRRKELEHMINNSPFVLIDWGKEDWSLRYISESITQFGYSAEEFYRGDIRYHQFIHPDDLPIIEPLCQSFEADLKRSEQNLEYRIITKDGSVRWIDERATIVRDENNNVARYYSVCHDMTARKKAELSLQESKEQMQKLAFYDTLTGLENRELFKQQLEYAIKISQRQQKTIALMYLDIDNFKVINDTLGHDAGDTLLKIVADRLTSLVRIDDSVARIGGDEFTVLLTEVKGYAGTKRVAEKILETFEKPIRLNTHELIISPSIGITLCPEDGADGALLMKNADLAMYHAKSKGKNNFQFFTPDMNADMSERMYLESELRRAIDNHDFALVYQPLVDLANSRCIGVEALVRWQHQERGVIPPDAFIGIAEDTGLIIPLGEQILETACRQVRNLIDQGIIGIKVNVNLSAKQFYDDELVNTVSRCLADTGIPADHIGFEITESLLMDHVEDAIDTLQQLKELGVSLSIDDFGTGYSSLSYIKRLPIDTIKIDRSFISDIPHDRNDMEITAAVVAMAHKLNLKVVAEGIEQEQQQQFLIENECDYGQGYYYSRPVSEDQLATNIKAINHKITVPALKEVSFS